MQSAYGADGNRAFTRRSRLNVVKRRGRNFRERGLLTRLASKRHGALPVGWHQSQKEGLGQSLGRQRSLQARHLPEIEPRVQQMRWRPHEASFTPCPPPILLLGQAQLNRHLLHSIRSVPGDFDPASVFLIFKHRDRDPDEAISFCLAPTQPVSSKRGLQFL